MALDSRKLGDHDPLRADPAFLQVPILPPPRLVMVSTDAAATSPAQKSGQRVEGSS